MATPTASAFVPRPTATSWIIVPELPSTATQADRGAEIYRLVCSSCHGDRGQGLTTEWRMTWNPRDQNCWQSKCHASNHPPDGFELPRYVPAIIGTYALARFITALDLYAYNHSFMPWHDPGSMTEEESWQVTAFLVRENGIDPIETPLDAVRAAPLLLHPQQTPSNAKAAPQTENLTAIPWLWFAAACFLLITLTIAAALYWRSRNTST